jgi:hypothetical protein
LTDSEYYDINSDYRDKAFSIFGKEEIDTANRYAEYWYYTNQFNTIPADVKSKDNGYKSILRSWIEYQTKPIPQETFERWKSLGLFAFGIAAEYGIKHLTVEGQTVLDPFLGSGTTALAALKLNRRFIGIELDPDVMDVARANITSYVLNGIDPAPTTSV